MNLLDFERGRNIFCMQINVKWRLLTGQTNKLKYKLALILNQSTTVNVLNIYEKKMQLKKQQWSGNCGFSERSTFDSLDLINFN